MSTDLVRTKIKRGNAPETATDISVASVGEVIRSLVGEPDATVTISKSDAAGGEVMLAISNGKYFLALFGSHGGVRQYIARGNERLGGKVAFTIEGELTMIESRYVLDAGTAAAAVQEWLTAGPEPPSSGQWKAM